MVDIDEVLNCHNDFLDMCLKDCMLTNPILLRTVTKLLHICMEFCSFIQVKIVCIFKNIFIENSTNSNQVFR